MKRNKVKSTLLLIASITATTGFFVNADEVKTSSQQFEQLLNEHWQTANKEQVFFRKDPDAFRMNGKLPSFSKASEKRRETYNQSLLNKLDKIELSALSAKEQVSYRLFKYERQTEAKSYQQLDRFYPMNIYAGFHSYFAGAPANMSFLTAKDYDNYLISLADFPRYNQEHIDNLTEAVAQGHTHYCESFKSYDKSISKHIVKDVQKSNFYQPLLTMPSRMSAADKANYQTKAAQLITETVIPEYQKFYDFFTQKYMTNCRQDVGISPLKNGSDYYQYLIEFYTTTSMSADDIHTLGLNEVARIRQEMNVIIKDLKFKGDFQAFINFLRTDPQFYTDKPRDLIEKASYITRKMAAQLPKWFTVLPRSTFDIKPAPNGGAYYVASDGSGTTSGTYFLDTQDLKSQPLYTLEALTFHEAEPGHHMQSAIAQEVDMPEFRKTLYHAAFGEGWGLYSERLGKEIGFYQDPYSDFGRLTYEAWRACRLVVDTGMHAKGWSRQQAIDYLAENTALSMADVTMQIDRYISWPAQALSYKIGEIKIRELRAMAEEKLGEKFNIRTFHDQMLKNGSLPMALLEELTIDWINQQLI
ncbi:MAG: DUF885 domain-containing protein [Colwellia sp.]|nr:DUF885 domain-containing protein [Colwellia sp.]